MPRPLRVEFADALFHVTARGVLKQAIVLDDHDRVRWMEYLKEAVLRFALELYAFTLMNNHYHLFVATPLANLGKAMQYLNGSWAMYFNVRHGRGGHLFERRYRGILVEEAGHYTEISRYVHLNPVRAGIVERPEEYPWSSYGGYHWGRMPLPWINYERVLAEFGEGKEARRRYREFIADGIGRKLPLPWKEAFEGWILGGRKFITKVYGMLASERGDGRRETYATPEKKPLDATLDEIAAAVCKEYQVSKKTLMEGGRGSAKARSAFVYITHEMANANPQSIASYLDLNSRNAIYNGVRRARKRAARNRDIARNLSRIETALRQTVT